MWDLLFPPKTIFPRANLYTTTEQLNELKNQIPANLYELYTKKVILLSIERNAFGVQISLTKQLNKV